MVKEVQQGSAGNEAARAAADAANLGAWTVATPAPTGAAFSGQPWQGEQIDAALAHLRGGSREDEETKSIKRAALNNIDEAIANTRDPEALRLLHEAKRSIEGAHSREAVLAAVTSAQGAIASAASASASAGAGESTSQAQMNAMHRELYANDPEYRRQTDMIRTEADDRMAGSNRESRRMQELADRLGIRTPLDAQVDERRQQYESARQRGDDLEARRLEVELHRLEVEQSRLRQQEAQRQGNPAAAEQFGQRGQQAQTELQHSIEAMRRQYEIYIQARERQLAARGVDPETRRQQLAAEQQQFEREVTSLTESRDVGRIRRQAREYGESTERVTQAPAIPGETPATAGHAAPEYTINK